MTTQDKTLAIETFRLAVLAALDEASIEVFGHNLGATDADLPKLFPAIDAQVQRLADRLDHTLFEGVVGSCNRKAERIELRQLGIPLLADDAAPGF